jgi:hypothetical protein
VSVLPIARFLGSRSLLSEPLLFYRDFSAYPVQAPHGHIAFCVCIFVSLLVAFSLPCPGNVITRDRYIRGTLGLPVPLAKTGVKFVHHAATVYDIGMYVPTPAPRVGVVVVARILTVGYKPRIHE